MFLTLLFVSFTLGFFLGRSRPSPAVTVSVDNSDNMRSLPVVADETAPALQVNINTAGKEELTILPGVGNVLAQRILDHRNRFGSFESVMDLMNVEGIGEKTMEQLLPYITTGG